MTNNLNFGAHVENNVHLDLGHFPLDISSREKRKERCLNRSWTDENNI